MIITDTRKTEKAIIEIYYCSKRNDMSEEREKAKLTIQVIKECFRLIEIFAKNNHAKYVDQLYFSDRNILTMGLEHMANKMYLHKNTLYTYRKRYCIVIDAILIFIKENKFFEFCHAA